MRLGVRPAAWATDSQCERTAPIGLDVFLDGNANSESKVWKANQPNYLRVSRKISRRSLLISRRYPIQFEKKRGFLPRRNREITMKVRFHLTVPQK
ncbi:MAG: hypothetical protein C5B49_02590 [Bdellovibrio sp.]|nr:MAG: hypothetical protein C5B49_02590 [Bdellovibrio sp.]